VWVVQSTVTDWPIATFTVKHELVTWLTQRKHQIAGFRLFRVPDGPRRLSADSIREVEISTLLEA
jgi:hypothetical protein